MGDAGEGLIDADARIQERMEELQLARAQAANSVIRNPEQEQVLASLQLARRSIEQQLGLTAHAARRAQLQAALADLERQIATQRASADR